MTGIRNACRPVAGGVAAAFAAAALLLSGCGDVVAGQRVAAGSGRPAAGSDASTLASDAAPPVGSRDQAAALADHLLAELALPPGAQPAAASRFPRSLEYLIGSPAVPTEVDVRRLFALSQPMGATMAFLRSHVPAGTRAGDLGAGGAAGGLHARFISYLPRSLPRGLFGARLMITVVAGPGWSGLRADAEVGWYPPRTAAENLDPAAFRQVTVEAQISGPKPRTVRALVASPAAIASLTAALDRLPAQASVPVSGCPAILASYQLSFAASARSAPIAVVNVTGCEVDAVTVAGRRQPALWDPSGLVAAAVRRLLRAAPAR